LADEKRGVQSIEVGGRLLECMAATAQPLMLREIAAGAQVTPAQAHAYLVSFRKIGYNSVLPGCAASMRCAWPNARSSISPPRSD